MRVSAGSALSYATMPGIFPRLKDLLFSGFGPVTQLIAIICFMAGLLPKEHPCFKKENRESYSLTRILASAANNVEFKWKNIDKIFIFALIVCGTVMMWLFVVGAIFYLMTSPSLAFSGMIQTANPQSDIAFMMLDKVFGIPGLYNSSVSMTAPFPAPFHVAMHELFRFYSLGIFFIALVIFLYHIVHWILQITQTGKVTDHLSDEVMSPYSDSPSHGFSWLPIRFVVAFGLLLPFGDGFNSAQWIALYTAKYGSGLATNAWLDYNSITGENPLGEQAVQLVAKPPTADNSSLIKSLILINACRWTNLITVALDQKSPKYVEGYVVNGTNSKLLFTEGSEPGFMSGAPTNPNFYNSKPSTIVAQDPNDDFIEIWNYSGKSNIRIVIGEFDSADPTKYQQYPGKVLPVCGEITIPVTGGTPEALLAAEGYMFAVMNVIFGTRRPTFAGDENEINEWLYASFREFRRTSSFVKSMMVPSGLDENYWCYFDPSGGPAITGPCDYPVKKEYWNNMMDKYFKYAFAVPPYSAYDFLSNQDTAYTEIDYYQTYIHATPTAYDSVGKPNPFRLSEEVKRYGWAGAGLWFNKIGEKNGSLYAAAAAVPIINKFPMVMEQIKDQRAKTDTKISGDFCEKFNPRKSGETSTNQPSERNQFEGEQAIALHSMCTLLYENQALNQGGITRTTVPSNPIEKGIQMFFSEFQLFNTTSNKNVNPMAQLTSVGRILIEKAILGVTASAASYAAGGVAYMSAGENEKAAAFAEGLGQLGDVTMTFALLGLVSGFILYYMLPMLPFIYFFFAVGRWVKSLFETLVGMPLWALAHLRVGGPGLPGNAAIGGYFLLLEVFIRPILTVFSLVIAFSLFSALVVGLNSVFSLVTTNLFGSPAPSATMSAMSVEFLRGMVDQFFLSIFYIMLVYVIGTGCFKLIDLVPDNIMRWSGAGVQSFGASDTADDMIEEWKFSLPTRFNLATSKIGSSTKEALYNPGARSYAKEKSDRDAAKAADDARQAEAARQAEKNKQVPP